ncbi:uncharacterized protein LOC122650849, partial [Telopea speciosissima]|uniref:uncharacterized protein LOC122650849 n=1 Tax=Telopea speciosissima TaxID=54955 RepID=UPI001CC3E142
FCFLVDQRQKVRSSKPAAGICSRCGGGATVADMKTSTRFCHVPFHCRYWKAIICGAILKSYRYIYFSYNFTLFFPNIKYGRYTRLADSMYFRCTEIRIAIHQVMLSSA